jgi:hypothetical protein
VRIARLEPAEALGYLELDLAHHLGDAARAPPARAALAAVLLATRRLSVEPRDEGLRAAVNRADASLDALMGLTGATFASGRVAIDASPGPLAFRFEHAGRTLRLVETPRLGEALADLAGRAAEGFDVRPA